MSAAAVLYREVQWRVTGAVAWSAITTAAPTGELALNQLSPNVGYDVRVRNVAANGMRSNWATFTITAPDNTQRLSQAHMAMLRVGGIGSAWTGFGISYTSTDTSATISCTAGTLQDGVRNPSYGASSVTVSGSPSTTATYYLYFDDPAGAGGTLTLGASKTYSDLSANQGRIFVGQVDVEFTATGGPAGGGSGNPGGGGGCVTVDMWLLAHLRAGRVQVGQAIDGAGYDPAAIVPRIVESNLIMAQPCMRLITESGCAVDASYSTPMTMPDGSLKHVPEMLGHLALVDDDGDLRWERVVALEDIGIRPVVLIQMNNQCFFAGTHPRRRVATHNLIAEKK